ncbi:hypothetical protein ACA910_009502 [Epithemia clementina (nom. ined.)]
MVVVFLLMTTALYEEIRQPLSTAMITGTQQQQRHQQHRSSSMTVDGTNYSSTTTTITTTTSSSSSDDINETNVPLVPTFPRWNREPLSLHALLDAVDRALVNDETTPNQTGGSNQFHMVHLIDAKFQMHTLVVTKKTDRLPSMWGRARAMINFVGRATLQFILMEQQQQQPDTFGFVHFTRLLSQQGYVPLLANYGDSRQCARELPILGLSAGVDCPTAFPVPNYELVKLVLRLQRSRRRQQRRSSSSSSSLFATSSSSSLKQQEQQAALIPQVIWRGSPTGRKDYHQNARIALCRKAMEFPHLVNAKLVLTKPEHKAMMEGHWHHPQQGDNTNNDYNDDASTLIGNWSTFSKYRAVLDLDGNSWSSRFASLLCSSQVVLKVQPADVDYFYPTLRPNVHYLPVHADWSNLRQQAERAVNPKNTRAMQTIVAAANAWCDQHMTLRQLVVDTAHIWEAYASVFWEARTNTTTTTTTAESNNMDVRNENNTNNIRSTTKTTTATTTTTTTTTSARSRMELLLHAKDYYYYGKNKSFLPAGSLVVEKHNVWNPKDARFRALVAFKSRFVW